MDSYTDPRTGVGFGEYSEEEIINEIGKIGANDVLFRKARLLDERPDVYVEDIFATKDQRTAPIHANIVDVVKGHYNYMNAMTKANREAAKILSLDEGSLLLNYTEQDRSAYLENALSLYKQAKEEKAKLPEDYPKFGIVDEAVRATAEAAGTMSDMIGQVAPRVLKGAGVGAAATSWAGAGASLGAAVGGTIEGFRGSTEYMVEQGYGEMLLSMVDPDQPQPIPLDIAINAAKKWQYAYAASETVGTAGEILSMLGGSVPGISVNIAKRIAGVVGGIGAEGVTEALQEIIGQYARYEAEFEFAKVRNSPFEKDFNDYLDLYEARQAARQAMLATGVMSLPGASYSSVKFLHDRKVETSKLLSEVKQEEDIARVADDIAAKQQYNEEVVLTNTLVSENLPTEQEVNAVKNDIVVRGTSVNENDLDNITLARTEEETDAAINTVETKIAESMSDRAATFLSNLYDFYSVEQVDTIERLIDARAQSMGSSFSEYVEEHGLIFEGRKEESPDVNAFTVFTQDNETIIGAFQNSTIEDFVHEIGHVFIRDLKGEDRAIADSFVGVDPGMQWDRQAQEKLTEAFTQYVSEGKGPTPELEGIFKKLANWISKVYKAIRGNVDINPEIKGVFDRMFVRNELDSGNIIRQQDLNSFNEALATPSEVNTEGKSPIDLLTERAFQRIKLNRALREKVEAAYLEEAAKDASAEILFSNRSLLEVFEKEAMDNALLSGRKEINEINSLPEYTPQRVIQRRIANVMRRMFDAGDRHGYETAKATMKAFIVREKARQDIWKKHKALRKQIIKKLKAGDPKTVSGRDYATIDPAVASFLKGVKKILKGADTYKGIKKAYIAMHQNPKLPGEYVTPEEQWANAFITTAVSRSDLSVREMQTMLKDLSDTIATAKANSPAVKRRLALKEALPSMLEEVRGPSSLASPEHSDTKTDAARLHEAVKERRKDSIRERIASDTTGFKLYGSLSSLVTNIARFGTPRDSVIMKAFDFFEARNTKQTEVREKTDRMLGAISDIYGLSKTGVKASYLAYQKQIELSRRDIEIEGLGGKYSKADLMYFMAMTDNPALTNKLVATVGSEEILTQVQNQINNKLNDQDRKVIDFFRSDFRADETYNPIDEVMFRIQGEHLNRDPYYIPTVAQMSMKDVSANDPQSVRDALKVSFFESVDYSSGASSSGHLKHRTKGDNKLYIGNIFTMWSSFTQEMAHYKAYAEQAMFANDIVADPEFARAVTIEYGAEVLSSLKSKLEVTVLDGTLNNARFYWLDRFRTAYVMSTIMAAGSVFLKQLIGSVQYMQYMPVSKFVEYQFKIWTQSPSKIKAELDNIYNSDYGKNRRMNHDRDLHAVISSGEFNEFKLNPAITNFLTMNVRVGDALAIGIGGAAYYRYLTNDMKMPPEQAMLEVAKFSEGTQQSGATQEQSDWQLGGSLGKATSIYSSGPLQAIRQELQAVRQAASGQITMRQMAKTLIIYHFMVPGLYALATSLFSGRDDADERNRAVLTAMLLGPFGAAYSIGELLTFLVSKLVGAKAWEPGDILTDATTEVIKFAEKVSEDGFDDFSIDDYAKATEAALQLAGVPVPVKRATYIGENLIEGDVWRAFLGQKPIDD